MPVKLFGYARVSTKDQREDRQLIALEEYGVEPSQVFVDKMSGKDFNRPQYRKLIKRISRGDTLVLPSIDRLGRNYDEMIHQWRLLTKDRGIDIVVLDMPLLDTRSEDRDLMGIFVSDLVLQVLSYVAECERDKIRQRQREGIAAAHRRGVRFGRPRLMKPDNFEEIADQWKKKAFPSRTAAEMLGVSQQTFLRWMR